MVRLKPVESWRKTVELRSPLPPGVVTFPLTETRVGAAGPTVTFPSEKGGSGIVKPFSSNRPRLSGLFVKVTGDTPEAAVLRM